MGMGQKIAGSFPQRLRFDPDLYRFHGLHKEIETNTGMDQRLFAQSITLKFDPDLYRFHVHVKIYLHLHIYTYIYTYIHIYIYVYVYILSLLVEHGRDDYTCNRGVYGKICFWAIVFLVFISICQKQWFSILGLGVVRRLFLPNPKIERNPLRNHGTFGNIKRNQKRNLVFSGRYSWVN